MVSAHVDIEAAGLTFKDAAQDHVFAFLGKRIF
jgi:hypothetical protein